jgi:hypothetical protein
METALYRRWEQAHVDAKAVLDAWNPETEPLPPPLVAAVAFHRQVEEPLFFPRLARFFVGGGPIPLLVGDHARLADALTAAWTPEQAAEWRASFRLHLRKEDLVLLPIARIRFTSREWEALSQRAAELWPD